MPARFPRKFIIAGTVAAISFSCGFLLGRAPTINSQMTGVAELRERGYRFISPLLDYQSTNAYTPGEIKSLNRDIRGYIEAAKSRGEVTDVAVYFRDLNNGPFFGINERTDFSPASLLKVQILIAALKHAEANPDYLTQMVLSVPVDDGVTQDIAPQTSLQDGQKYSVNDLIQRMIFESDNHAKNLIIMTLSPGELDRTYSDLGLKDPSSTSDDYMMDVVEYSSFYRILYNASYLSKTMSEKALELLSQTDYNDGMVAAVPKGIAVSHKFGERELGTVKQLHDCGIIYYPHSPVLLCIMTRGREWNNLKTAIQNITKSVSRFVASSSP